MDFFDSFPYRVESVVGEGGMGIVYRAHDPQLHRSVAIKVLRPELLDAATPRIREESRLRFLQEARAAAGLTHPGVTTIYRIGEEQGRPYIVMEWLDGRTLEAILRERAPLPIDATARLGVDLCETLEATHSAGVVHRDIKPSNLILLADGRLKVTDFGLARMEGGNLVETRAGEIVATPLYASPEQLRGENADARTDIFSVGVVLYLCVTGQRPFSGLTIAELMASVLGGEPVPPRQINPAIPAAVDGAILRALSKSRDDRFPRARAMADALRPFACRGRAVALMDASVSPMEGSRTSPLSSFVDEAEAPSPQAKKEGAPDLSRAVAVIRDLPADIRLAVARVVASWPRRELDIQAVRPLLDRLLEKPVHTDAFAGGLVVGTEVLLILFDGHILAALDLEGNRRGAEVIELLPLAAVMGIHAVPASLSREVVPLLASLLGPRVTRHRDLDSSFVNLPALARKLAEEGFTGDIVLRRGEDVAVVLLDKGREVLNIFSKGWAGVPLNDPWEAWVSSLAVRADVEERRWAPLAPSYRRSLPDKDSGVGRPAAERTPKSRPTVEAAVVDQPAKDGAGANAPVPRGESAPRGRTPAPSPTPLLSAPATGAAISSGRFTKGGLPAVLRELVRRLAVGRIDVTSSGTTRHLWFEAAQVRAVVSDLEEEKLGSWLVARGLLEPQTMSLALLRQPEGVRFGTFLVQEGLLTVERLTEEIQALAVSIVSHMLLDAGEYRFEPEDRLPVDAASLEETTASLLVAATRALADERQVARLIDSSAYVWSAQDALLAYQQAHLTSHEAFVLSRVDGTTTVSQLQRLVPLPGPAVTRSLAALVVAGLLELRRAATPRPIATNRAEELKDVPAAEESLQFTPDQQREHNEIVRLAGEIRSRDYYRRLKLARGATQDQIHTRFLELAKLYHPDRAHDPHLLMLRRELAEIYSALKEACDTLENPDHRSRYDHTLGDSATPHPTKVADGARQQAARPAHPEASVTRAKELVRSGDIGQAVHLLDQAVRLDPRAETLLMLARLEFRDPMSTQRALDHLKHAVTVSPMCTEAWLELANFWGTRGQPERQKQCLQKILAYDPKNEDARKALAALKEPPKKPTGKGR